MKTQCKNLQTVLDKAWKLYQDDTHFEFEKIILKYNITLLYYNRAFLTCSESSLIK